MWPMDPRGDGAEVGVWGEGVVAHQSLSQCGLFLLQACGP